MSAGPFNTMRATRFYSNTKGYAPSVLRFLAWYRGLPLHPVISHSCRHNSDITELPKWLIGRHLDWSPNLCTLSDSHSSFDTPGGLHQVSVRLRFQTTGAKLASTSSLFPAFLGVSVHMALLGYLTGAASLPFMLSGTEGHLTPLPYLTLGGNCSNVLLLWTTFPPSWDWCSYPHLCDCLQDKDVTDDIGYLGLSFCQGQLRYPASLTRDRPIELVLCYTRHHGDLLN